MSVEERREIVDEDHEVSEGVNVGVVEESLIVWRYAWGFLNFGGSKLEVKCGERSSTNSGKLCLN
jgi:hypothetical protein